MLVYCELDIYPEVVLASFQKKNWKFNKFLWVFGGCLIVSECCFQGLTICVDVSCTFSQYSKENVYFIILTLLKRLECIVGIIWGIVLVDESWEWLALYTTCCPNAPYTPLCYGIGKQKCKRCGVMLMVVAHWFI